MIEALVVRDLPEQYSFRGCWSQHSPYVVYTFMDNSTVRSIIRPIQVAVIKHIKKGYRC
jgi:hypothetical protein